MSDQFTAAEFVWRLAILVTGNILGGLATHYYIEWRKK
jgi:hypothetical protein